MKKLICLLFTLTLFFSLASTASADVIWEPYDDSFYTRNQEDFTHAGYYAYANSPAGEVTLYKKPGGKTEGTMTNGELCYIQYIYTGDDGTQWALFSDETYALLTDLLNRYDEEFFDDHPEITDSAPQGFSVKIPVDEPILLWTYPGGVSHVRSNYWDEDIMSGLTSYYTDKNGLVWGYMGYWFGHQDVWICLSDYNNPDLQEPEIYLGEINWGEGFVPVEEAEIIQKGSFKLLYVILPLAAAGLAAVLLIFWPKKKQEGK